MKTTQQPHSAEYMIFYNGILVDQITKLLMELRQDHLELRDKFNKQ